MASLRDIRRRIKSVKNTAQITKAMQMVASSKMRRAQDAATAGRPFTKQLLRLIGGITGHMDQEDVLHPLLEKKTGGKHCVLLISTDKGLCGPLNTNLLRVVHDLPADTVFVTLGRKGRTFLSRLGREIAADFPLHEKMTFADARRIGKFLQERFLEGEYSEVSIAYSAFINTITQRPTVYRIMPLSLAQPLVGGVMGTEERQELVESAQLDVEPIFEPSPAAVLDKLLPQIVNYAVWHCILESKASEHSARMVAMKNATDNAKQLVKDLTLEYNKARQASITNEILEIATAQMALG